MHEVKNSSKTSLGKPNREKRKPRQTKNTFKCKKCGQDHELKKCPAYGQICHKCQKRNHYAKMCLSNSKGSAKQVDEYKLDNSDTDEFFIGALGTNTRNEKDWMQSMVINEIGH